MAEMVFSSLLPGFYSSRLYHQNLTFSMRQLQTSFFIFDFHDDEDVLALSTAGSSSHGLTRQLLLPTIIITTTIRSFILKIKISSLFITATLNIISKRKLHIHSIIRQYIRRNNHTHQLRRIPTNLHPIRW